MSEWALKRFWKAAEVQPLEGGFTVTLDGRPVRTPGKTLLTTPSRAMAEAVAREWATQEERVDPGTMPVTRSVNSAHDKVMVRHAEVADFLTDYGASDLLCYRAEGPEGLTRRQSEVWDPLLDWAEVTLGARLVTAFGVMPVDQPPVAVARLRGQVHAMDAFQLAGFHELVTLSGSLVLAFAVIHGRLGVADAWSASRIDEDWQEAAWGVDAEAAARDRLRREAFAHGARFYRLARGVARRKH